MELRYESGVLESITHRCLMVLVTKDGTPLNGPAMLKEALAPFVESGELGDSLKDMLYLPEVKGIAAGRVLIVNVGESLKKPDHARQAVAAGWKSLRKRGFTELLISLDGFADPLVARAVFEGAFLGDYQYTAHKSETDKLPKKLETLTIHSSDQKACEASVSRWHAIVKGTARARDLSQMPPNILHPGKFAELATAWGASCGYKVSVLNEDELSKQGFGSMLAVGAGSAQPSKFIVMEFEPKGKPQKTFAFVGKAVTFDSGGLSLKPSNAMAEMKGDMGGGAAVVGIMSVLKDVDCPYRVIGLVPAVENMPSAGATRPSDVVKSLSGITIEINNTDAEGRLILADALTYADRFKPDYVVDFATLTGACLVALGPKVCAVMGNNQQLVNAVLQAGEEVHEPFWQLPLVEEYKAFLKSQTADISNVSSSRWGGTITAGLFLQRFADQYQWAHCDIAPSVLEKADDYNLEGGTGCGVRMALRMMEIISG